MIHVLRLSLKSEESQTNVIICNCRGASEREVNREINRGAQSLLDLQRCGIGDQCGSCHNLLRNMLAAANARDEEHVAACGVGELAPA